MNYLKSIDIQKLTGVGPKKAQLLNNINIYNIYDLLNFYPRAYEDMKTFYNIEDKLGEKGLFYLEILTFGTIKRIRKNLELLTFKVTDGNTGAELVFFNQSFYKNAFKPGRKIYVYGSVQKLGHVLQIINPRIKKKREIGYFEPIYNLTKGISNNDIKKFTLESLNKYKDKIIDYFPEDILRDFDLINLSEALRKIHFPVSLLDIELSKRRLSFNELFLLQYSLQSSSFRHKEECGQLLLYDKFASEISDFLSNLPFKITNAQEKVLKEIVVDLTSGYSMNRLVQGDVGSGKTVVAAIVLYLAYLNGRQSAFMAPTEILARQHFFALKEFFNKSNVNIKLLTGSTPQKEKDLIYSDLGSGIIDIIIGTHALIQDKVNFNNLGLTIVDEQHRFGVNQRKTLYYKGNNPHNLSMTATPIPRSLALIIYGDMDISIIDELPPGRQPIDTFVVDDSYNNRIDNFVIKQISEGRQVYVICPLIEENDQPLKSLEETYKHYSSDIFIKEGINTGFLHGKMSNEEKNSIMKDFSDNKIQILVSTTVIEVGINVPNANLMIINNADRFGLSQLHQLRGRVGRGSEKSYCILFNNNTSEVSYRRMKIMKTSNDGFYIAEKDLELRGEGEILGTRQHGLPELKIVNIKKDMKLINQVKNNFDFILKSISYNKDLYSELNSLSDSLIND